MSLAGYPGPIQLSPGYGASFIAGELWEASSANNPAQTSKLAVK